MMVIKDLAKTRHDPKFKMAIMPINVKKRFKLHLFQNIGPI